MNFNVTVIALPMSGVKTTTSRRAGLLIPFMVAMLTMHVFAPFAAADGMSSCEINGGECDDYNPNHDLTQSQQDWVNATYDFKLVDSDTIELEINWAIHEFDREKLGFSNDPALDAALAADGLDADDGAPADLLRNFMDESLNGPGTPTLRDQLKTELNDALENALDSIGIVSGQTTDYTNEFVQQGSTTACSTDPTTDSVYGGENSGLNNAFHPPVCIYSSIVLDMINTNFSLDSSGGLDLDRALQGMLVMGAEVEADFTLLTIPGTVGYYSFSPPDYADIVEVNSGGVLAARAGTPSYFAGEWVVDLLDAPAGASDLETPISVRLGHRDGSFGTNTVSIPEGEKAIDLSVTLDLRDESAASIDFVAGISYLNNSIMSDWGISLLNISESATLPLVTSDGIRLAYHNGLVPLDSFTSAFPINDIASGISDSVGTDDTITMNQLYWVSDSLVDGLDTPGGLNYTHSTGCTEVAQPGQDLHYCLRGTSAMTSEYPVFLRSTSQPFSGSLLDILKNNFDDGDLLEYVEVIQESDLRNLFNSGISIESVLPGDFLDSVIPEDLPPAELTLEIILPNWVRTIDGNDSIILQKTLGETSDIEISLAGTDPYDWRNEIRDEDMNVVCTTVQRTCISSAIELDVSALRINEWSQSVSMDFALDAEVSIYRVIVPLEEINQTGSTKVNFEAAPSDLVRVGLDIASRLAEPKTFDNVGNICTDEQDYSVCDENLSLIFTPEGLTDFSVDVGEMITAFIQQSGAELPDLEDSPFGQVDLSGFEINTKVDGLTGLDQDIGDEEPITLSVKIPKVEFKLELDGNLGELMEGNSSSLEMNFFANAFRGLIVGPMVNAAELLGSSLTNGLVSGSGITYPSPDGDATSISFSGNTSIAEEYDLTLNGPVSVILPRGITIEDVEDEGGYLTITEVDGRQKITYNIPDGEFEDTISFRIQVSWLYLFMQFWVYPTFVVLLLALFIRRRRRKKRLKKQRKAQTSQQASKVAIGDSEFADLKGFKSEGLHGELQQFEDYSTKAPPPMIDLGDERFD